MPETDVDLLQTALIGYEIQIVQLRAQIAAIQKRLGTAGVAAAPGGPPGGKRRRISAAARKRISAAQKRRWAEYKKQRG
jgi:hypothetical protein